MTKAKIVGSGFAFFVLVLGGLEGMRQYAYQDIVGVWTICYGHTEGVKPGDTMTPLQCKEQLEAESKVYWDQVDRLVVPPMLPREQIAFSLLTYNIGINAFKTSTLLRYANSGNMPAACLQILKWVKNPRLARRRQIEHDICIGATVE